MVLDGRTLTPAGVAAVARQGASVELHSEARERNAAAAGALAELLRRGEQVYGVTTGVGGLRSREVQPADRPGQQLRLLRSHACGGGRLLAPELVRAAMVVRANQLGAGGAGVSDELLEALVAALNAGFVPAARELGSLGTGDLTVLAEIGLALVGEGRAWRLDAEGDSITGADSALADAGLRPPELGPRDGIAFMSSSAATIGHAALLATDAERLLAAAFRVAALSFIAAGADPVVLDERVQAARPHAGQVEGTALDALTALEGVLAVELNAATENALLDAAAPAALPSANFHTGALALALDGFRVALAQSRSLGAARASALLDRGLMGLPAALSANPGPSSGAMMLEYTAHAAAADVRVRATPAAAQTTTVGGGVESHASFAPFAARLTHEALESAEVATATELVLAVRALRMRGLRPSGTQTGELFADAAARLDADTSDRALGDDIEAARRLLFDGDRAG